MIAPKDVTLLIVDDDETLRRTISFDFQRKGYRVLSAASGNEAFEIVKNNKIHVVLSDVRMPNGDGVELLDKIKALNPDIPVVMFITGFSDISTEEALRKGAAAVFSKPFERKEVMAAVVKAIEESEAHWQARLNGKKSS